MSALATRRLIDAAAALSPVDRALFHLWVNRGLSEAALAKMAGLTAEVVASRRAGIIQALSTELGLPPADVERALVDLVASSAADATGSASDERAPSLNGGPGGISEPAAVESAAVTPAASAGRRSAWPVAIGILAVLAILAVILLARGARSPSPSPSSTTTTAKATAPAQVHPPTSTVALTALPGGPAGAHGTVAVLGRSGQLRLELAVSGLPTLRRGHYEVWLYNSILDSTALGRLGPGAARLDRLLPSDASRFRWIDVSVQPPGLASNSGESVLRAPLPATGLRR